MDCKVYLEFWDTGKRKSSLYPEISSRISRLSGKRAQIIRDNQDSKPGLLSPEGWFFNLSYSGTLACCGYCTASIGVDLEEHRPRDFYAIAETWFKPAEMNLIKEKNSTADFYLLWTRKEAWVKLHGLSVWHVHSTPNLPDNAPGLKSCHFNWKGRDYSLSVCAADDCNINFEHIDSGCGLKPMEFF